MIKREINLCLDELYELNENLGGMEYKRKTEDIYYEYYNEFKRKFEEVVQLQQKQQALFENNIKGNEMLQLRSKINYGIQKLKDYIRNIQMAFRKIQKKETDPQKINAKREAIDKCHALLDAFEKKNNIFQKKTLANKKKRLSQIKRNLYDDEDNDSSEGTDDDEEGDAQEMREEEEKLLNKWREWFEEIVFQKG